MTAILYTVDTELSPGFHQRGLSADENLRRNVFGEVADGAWGIGYQMRELNAHGLKGVFFVEALCADVYGDETLKRIVGPILDAGHEVQLHLHPEWLKWADVNVAPKGGNLADFDQATQRRLLERGIIALMRAGAPRPTAFRAGNYGANNETLRALADLGLKFDSSYNQTLLRAECRIVHSEALNAPIPLDGVIEVPITFFEDYPGHTRSVQLCALSAAEMRWVLVESIAKARPTAVVVSHSFELLNEPRTRANRIHLDRFGKLCATLAKLRDATTARCFAELAFDQLSREQTVVAPLKSNALRTAHRMLEQTAGALLFARA